MQQDELIYLEAGNPKLQSDRIRNGGITLEFRGLVVYITRPEWLQPKVDIKPQEVELTAEEYTQVAARILRWLSEEGANKPHNYIAELREFLGCERALLNAVLVKMFERKLIDLNIHSSHKVEKALLDNGLKLSCDRWVTLIQFGEAVR